VYYLLPQVRHVGAFDKMCTGMYCTSGGPSTVTLVVPADGTSCGDQKVWAVLLLCLVYKHIMFLIFLFA